MIWLIGQMWILLLAAFAFGLFMGWWMKSARGAGPASAANCAELGGTIADDNASRAPELLAGPVRGPKDDLSQIIGLDGATEAKLNALGIFYLRQIADWDAAHARWVEEALDIRGRIDNEHWIEQARSTLP